MIDPNKDSFKANINNIQGYNPYQIKKERLSGDISKFPPVQCRSPYSKLHFIFIKSTD